MLRIVVALAICGTFAASAVADERIAYVDLQLKANQKLSDNLGTGREGNNLVNLPKGEQTFADVKFKIEEGFLQLGCRKLKEQRPNKLEGIEVAGKIRKLHILHATGYGSGSRGDGAEGELKADPLFIPDDTQIAEYRINYEDATAEKITVVYGRDVRDWFYRDPSKGVTKGKIAWTGENDLATRLRSKVRLYVSSWENPHPDKYVVSIDFIKTGDTIAAPFCLAMTTIEP